MIPIPFKHINWTAVPKEEHPGTTGKSFWQTLQFEGLRVRIVEYSANYLADHWCQKGHIVYCLDGSFTSEEEGGGMTELHKGMSYIVSDDLSSHRSSSSGGATLLIIDGDFLKLK